MVRFRVSEKGGNEVECVAFEETAHRVQKVLGIGVKCNLRVSQRAEFDSVVVMSVLIGEDKLNAREHWWDKYMREEFGGPDKHAEWERQVEAFAKDDGKVRCYYKLIDRERGVWSCGIRPIEDCVQVEGFYYLRNLIPQEAYGRSAKRQGQKVLAQAPRAQRSAAREEETGEYPSDFSG